MGVRIVCDTAIIRQALYFSPVTYASSLFVDWHLLKSSILLETLRHAYMNAKFNDACKLQVTMQKSAEEQLCYAAICSI